MDPLTHTMVGAALARTRVARGTPLGATALIVGANLPDIDVLSHFLGDDASLAFRRGWTHGPAATAVLPVLLAVVLFAIDARLRRRDPSRPPLEASRLLGLAFLGTWTHPALDWLNTYGIRLLMPFDERWFYGDAVFILDPWLWLLLGGALFIGSSGRRAVLGWALLAVLATLLIFVARSMLPSGALWVWLGGLVMIALARQVRWIASAPARIATAALVLVSLYIAGMVVTSRAVENHVRHQLMQEGVQDVRDLMVGPAPANPFHWQVIVETEEQYRRGTFRWWPQRSLELDPRAIARPRPSPLVEAVLGAAHLRGTVNWMRFPFLEIEETDAGYVVHLVDARYASFGDRGFGTVRVELDRQLRVLDAPLNSAE